MEKIYHHPKIVEIKEFFSAEYCSNLIDFLNGTQSGEDNWNPACFPSVLGVNVGGQTPTESISIDDLHEIRKRMHGAVEELIGRSIKNVTMSGHKYPTGSYAAPHSDTTELDGTPNAWQMNKYASILYLNDDYEGGEIYFPNYNIEIAPGAGSLVLFEGNHDFIHGVREITSGDRYTILAFWDNLESMYDKEFIDEKIKAQRVALDYVESTHDYGQYNGRSFGHQNPDDLLGILWEKEK